MEIIIKVDDITTFSKALNNAEVAYGEILWALKLGCSVPKVLEPLRVLDEEELDKRMACLMDVYDQVEEIEKMLTKD